MPKTFIKKTGGWTEIKSIFVKKTTGWAEVKNVFLKKTSGWVKVFTKASLPDTTTSPSIRTTNNSGSGTVYDGPVAVSPIYLNENLFGKDGVYTNYTSIFGRKFTSGDSASALTRSLVINGDLFTSGGGVTTAIRQSVEEKYLFYELTVQNGSSANEIYPISSSVFMIKSQPYSNSFTTTGALEVGNFVTANIDIEYYYYNRPELSSSYVKWYVGNYFGDTSGTPVQTTSLTDALDSTSSTQYLGSDLLYIDSSYFDKYVTAILVVESSWTRYYGYATSTYQLDYVYAGGGGKVSSPLSFSNIVVKDYYNNSGLDNRSLWPTGTVNKYTATLTGYVSGTTIRIRYRIFNSNNSTYYKPSTATASTASASWDSWNSDGSGNGYISDVSISGGTATISDNLYLDETVFNGGGAYPGNWELHVELSAIKSGGTRVYYINPYDTYYISKRIDPSISATPSTVSPNTDVTISGTFAGFPATPSTNAYPKQYRVTYGDGANSNSGWLPVPEWTFGTVNPTYSLTKQYSTNGTYTASITTIPFGTEASTTITVATIPNAFTYTISNESSVTSASTPTQSRVSTTSNLVLVDFATSKPTDTENYTLNISGAGSAAYVSNNNTAVNQTITSVNQYDSSGNLSASGTYEWVTGISSAADTAKAIDFKVTATGKTRTFNANVSTTANASSWAINFTWSGATASGVTYYSNGSGTNSASTGATVTVYTNSMPVKIAEITGASNPTITINSITAYSGSNQTGGTRAGTSGTTTSLSSVARPTSTSSTSSANYIYYSTDPQAFTINQPTKTDAAAANVPTINTISYTESTTRVDFTFSSSNAVRYRTIAYGTAYSPDSTQSSPSRGPFYTTSTSDYWGYDEAGTVTIGVGATQGIASATVTWGASTNAQSYIIGYKIGTSSYTSPSQTGTSFTVNTGPGTNTFEVTSVTAYKNNDGTGTSKTGTLPTTATTSPTESYSSYGTSSITVTAFVTPAPTTPPSFVFSRNLNGGTSTTRRNWFWNVSSGVGSYSSITYDLYVWDQTTQPTTTGTTNHTWFSTFGPPAPTSNANTYNFSGTTTPSYRTMARGSSYTGTNGTTIPTRSTASWGKARCRVVGTNGSTYNSDWTAYL
jgi:hypothetical protein